MPIGQRLEGRPQDGQQSDPMASLETPLQFLKGVGKQGEALLKKLGLLTIGDLLSHYPRRWEDRSHFGSVADAADGQVVSLRGKVLSASLKRPKPHVNITEVILQDNGASLKLIWFNQPYMERTFKGLAASGRSVVVYGLVKRQGWTPEIVNPEWEELTEDEDALSVNRIVPIYPLTDGLRQIRLRRIMDAAIRSVSAQIEEGLPPEILLKHSLVGAQASCRNIHFPESFANLAAARRRLIFEEFFLFQAMLAERRRCARSVTSGLKFQVDHAWLDRALREVVPFTLTTAQMRAIGEITNDLVSGKCMNRLLQGDVGSGKTVVALAAMLMAVENGCQAALMAPTEILAQQHAIVLRRMLDPVGIAVELSTGSQGAREKRAVKDRLLGGQSRIVVGTHALIQDNVEFAKLGLVVVDEQHRFGVLQRQALVKKGEQVHVLVMTATPIPRTLTLTLYGDLETSVLDELPPGRKPVATHWKAPDRRESVYTAAERLLRNGRQVYVVCPLIEESDKLQAASATALAEEMSSHVFPDFRVGLLHGQMKSDDKDQVMTQFKAHEIDVLVSTTVIEVGIDVPNASVIIVEDADRFGLAQLHQLRGRVGRGAHSSYCVLIAEPKTEVGRARMQIMTQTNNGFVIAEEDLKLRGPGEFFGTKQSGMPNFAIADVVRDLEILIEARDSAFGLIQEDPGLKLSGNQSLKSALLRYSRKFDLLPPDSFAGTVTCQ